MENIKIRCRSCGKELEGHPSKTVCCGCPNMATIRGDKTFESSGNTNNFFYQRACAIVGGAPDPIDKMINQDNAASDG